ncbi:hypothetical protein [Mesorhizobium sp. A623]
MRRWRKRQPVQSIVNKFERQMNAGISAGSAGRAQSPCMKETPAMLARRFTIVCLLTTLFGMAFAVLVAQADRQPRTWHDMDSGLCGGGLCSSHFNR